MFNIEPLNVFQNQDCRIIEHEDGNIRLKNSNTITHSPVSLVRIITSGSYNNDDINFILDNLEDITIHSNNNAIIRFSLNNIVYIINRISKTLSPNGELVNSNIQVDKQLVLNLHMIMIMWRRIFHKSQLIADTFFWNDYDLLKELLLLDMYRIKYIKLEHSEIDIQTPDRNEYTPTNGVTDLRVNYDAFYKWRKPRRLIHKGVLVIDNGLSSILYSGCQDFVSQFWKRDFRSKQEITRLLKNSRLIRLVSDDTIQLDRLQDVLSNDSINDQYKLIFRAAADAAQILFSGGITYVNSKVFDNLQYCI